VADKRKNVAAQAKAAVELFSDKTANWVCRRSSALF